jgi:hypothetical protein
MTLKVGRLVAGTSTAMLLVVASAQAQVPADIKQGLIKIGQIVDPACTAKLYRPLMPKNDYNTYWPPGAAAPAFTGQLYPGITIARDQSFGPNPKDVVDVFTPDKAGGGKRPILMYVPGGAGNKIEQQAREANAFYDNIGRWAVKNGMVAVTVQRHPGANWDDGGRDLSLAVDWVRANAATFNADPERIVMWAHSAGNGPLGIYVSHPERWKNGVTIKGAIFMSGIEIAPGVAALTGGGARGGGGRGAGGGNPLAGAGQACGLTNALGNDGAIAGPSGALAGAPAGRGAAAAAGAPGTGRGAGAPGGGGRGQLTPEQQAERDSMPGLKATPVKILIVRAELDPGVMGDMTAVDKAVQDALCAADGPKAKDGKGHCPTLLYLKDHSHVSEVFALDTADKKLSDSLLKWIKAVK